MQQILLNTAECLQWLQETENITEALDYRMAVITDERIELYARNHYQCQPRVYEFDTGQTDVWVLKEPGEPPQKKFLAHRPPVDVEPEVVETTEDLETLAVEVGPFVTCYRFALVYRDDGGKRLRAISLYARTEQLNAPTTLLFGVSSQLPNPSWGQQPNLSFVTSRPATKADIVNPVTVESLEGDGNR